MKNKHYIFTRDDYYCGEDADSWETYQVYTCISHDDYNGSEGSERDVRAGIILHDAGIGYDDGLYEFTRDKIESILLDNEITYEIVDED